MSTVLLLTAALPLTPITIDQSVPFRTTGEYTLSARLFSQTIDDERQIAIAIGNTILVTERQRDFDHAYLVPTRRGYDYLIVETTFGGPGTCLHHQDIDIYLIDSFSDGGSVIQNKKSVSTGGLLACTEEYAACGCGVWEAEVRFSYLENGLLQLSTQHSTQLHGGGPAESPPPPVVLEL
ncbi:MAG: hypothetical protein AAFV53_22520 [Myxococcota bacterium]